MDVVLPLNSVVVLKLAQSAALLILGLEKNYFKNFKPVFGFYVTFVLQFCSLYGVHFSNPT